MNLIVRHATIVDPESQYHGQTVDLLIENGTIQNIGANLPNPNGIQEFSRENLHVSQSWFDSSVCFGEPGYEERETIAHGLQVAGQSGFAHVALQPNANPVTDSLAQVSFALSRAQGQAAQLHPIGALTKKSEGLDLAELYDMKNAGAVAFGDYQKSLSNANLLKIGLQYVQDFDALLIAFSQDDKIKGAGVVNEGIVSTRLGLKGIPNLAEDLVVSRNLTLLEYTGGKLHIPTISTLGSVALIRQAKAKGLDVSCSVAVHHLVLTDAALQNFDTRLKVSPPLRTDADRKVLLDAVLDGTIDCITSDHCPIDIEHKKMEFDLAKDGSIGLESAFGALLTVLPLEVVVEKLTSGKKRFGISQHPIAAGQTASLTLFNPDGDWTFGKQHIASKSKNAAFLGQKLKGKAYGIYNQGKLEIHA